MAWNDKPEVRVTRIAPDDTALGNKCRFKILARGWGKLSVITEHSRFTACFAGEKSWELTLPVSEETRISAMNLFGKTDAQPGLTSSAKFMSEEEFFKNLRVTHKLRVIDILPPPLMRLPDAVRATPLTNKIRGDRIRVISAQIKLTGLARTPVIKQWQPIGTTSSRRLRNNFRLKINPSHMQFKLRAQPLDLDRVFETINREGAPK
jgi:hypothetical protein